MNKFLLFIASLLLFSLTSCTYFTGVHKKKSDINQTQKEGEQLKKSQEDTYKVGIGDVLEIITWKEPDFSRDVIVRVDGKISFPLLDDIDAAGRTTKEIKDELTEKLKLYVTTPVVSVSVKLAESQKIYIIGEIMQPGEYPLVKRLTVIQALAMAKGFTEWASKSDIALIRTENGNQRIIPIDYDAIADGEDPDSNVVLKADDIILVP